MTVSYNSDYGYAGNKLVGSLVRLNGLPVIIDQVDEEDGDTRWYNSSNNRGTCRLEELDLEPVPLGYVNQRLGCAYASRIPARYWRQGLRSNLINVVGASARSIDISCRELVNTILNNYPSMSSCFDSIANGECREKAFSRDFALGNTRGLRKKLIYKGFDVGFVTHQDGGYNTTFDESYSYLQEVFQEQTNANNS